jgi:hypothetical protein
MRRLPRVAVRAIRLAAWASALGGNLAGGSSLGAEPEFQLIPEKNVCPEYGTVSTNYAFLTGTRRVVFVPLADWRMTTAPTRRRVMFEARNTPASISLSYVPRDGATQESLHRNTTPTADGSWQDQTSRWREGLTTRFPGRRVIEEYDAFAQGRRARVFHLQFRSGRGEVLAAIVGGLPIEDGYLQVELVAKETAGFLAAQFKAFLGSLQVAPRSGSTTDGRASGG